jgi:hypothetical protein
MEEATSVEVVHLEEGVEPMQRIHSAILAILRMDARIAEDTGSTATPFDQIGALAVTLCDLVVEMNGSLDEFIEAMTHCYNVAKFDFESKSTMSKGNSTLN